MYNKSKSKHGAQVFSTCTVTILYLSLSLLYRRVMSAPNVLRIGTTENIFVECQDCIDGDITVKIRVMTHPTKDRELKATDVILTKKNNFQGLGQITVMHKLV